jgi:hypothetical protein
VNGKTNFLGHIWGIRNGGDKIEVKTRGEDKSEKGREEKRRRTVLNA